jgi:hypothetical protein
MFEAEVDNRDRRARSGLFGEAEVILNPDAQSIVVPAESVVEFAGVEKVWKVVNGKSQEQVVQTGQRRQNSVQILEGLAAGDSILRHGRHGRAARVLATKTLPIAEIYSANLETAGEPQETESTPVPSGE